MMFACVTQRNILLQNISANTSVCSNILYSGQTSYEILQEKPDNLKEQAPDTTVAAWSSVKVKLAQVWGFRIAIAKFISDTI